MIDSDECFLYEPVVVVAQDLGGLPIKGYPEYLAFASVEDGVGTRRRYRSPRQLLPKQEGNPLYLEVYAGAVNGVVSKRLAEGDTVNRCWTDYSPGF